jgi:hypothetical protein
MDLIALRIDSNSSELNDYASETLDDVVLDAVVRKFRKDGGFVLATIWRDSVHEVIYQTPLRFFWSRLRRDRELFKFYGDGQSWSEDSLIDFGKSRKRADGEVRALYSEIMDYMTFVTTEFDAHRSDIRWKDILD